MPADLLSEAGAMARCYGWLLAAAVPVACGCAWADRRRVGPWRVPRAAVTGHGLLLLFAVQFLAPTLIASLLAPIAFPEATKERPELRQLLTIAAGLGSLAVLTVAASMPAGTTRRQPAGKAVAVGVAAWAVGHPVVFGVYWLTAALMGWAGAAPDEHPLVRSVPAGVADQLLMIAVVGLIVPTAEEAVFRGRLLPWLAARRDRPAIAVLASVLLTGLAAQRPPAIAFALAAALLTLLVRRRMWRAVLASAGLFAAGHAAVWPTPVPLFVGGAALGWLYLRTGSVLACAVAHGLFNGVSVLYLLRG